MLDNLFLSFSNSLIEYFIDINVILSSNLLNFYKSHSNVLIIFYHLV